MPASRITAADVDRQAVHFCVREFGLKGLVVPSDPRRACFPDNYDLIFVGSLLTHLPVPTRLALLDVLVGVFQPAGLLNERILHRIVALVLGAVSAGAWPMFVAANGAARGDDMRAYLCLADALWSLRVVTSARTRLPIFLVACRSVAATLGTDLAWVVAILQTLLLSGNAARAPTLGRVGSRHPT